MTLEEAIQEILTRVNALDACVAGNQIPDPRDGQPDPNIAKMFNDILMNSLILQVCSQGRVNLHGAGCGLEKAKQECC